MLELITFTGADDWTDVDRNGERRADREKVRSRPGRGRLPSVYGSVHVACAREHSARRSGLQSEPSLILP